MADYIVTSGELTTVANAIRAKNGTSSSLSWPDGFVSGIGSGSGGGGESDFSTAEVTVNSSTSLMYKLELSNYYDYENTGIMSPSIASGDIDGSIILNTILYKGQAMCIFVPISANTPNISVSGNIQDLGQQTYIITGDCTITIS